jgi:hypothetical protein
MFKGNVQNLWKNSGGGVGFFDNNYPHQDIDVRFFHTFLWKTQEFSHTLHISIQTIYTAFLLIFISVRCSVFHIFHRTYYSDYYLVNKKGIL